MVGPPYVTALRLFANAEHYWVHLDREAAKQGTDYLTLPIDRFCNVVLGWLMERVKDTDRLMYDLNKPAAGMGTTATDAQLEEEANAFMAFAAMHGVTPESSYGATDAEN